MPYTNLTAYFCSILCLLILSTEIFLSENLSIEFKVRVLKHRLEQSLQEKNQSHSQTGLDYVIAKLTTSILAARFKAANKRMSDRKRIRQDPEQRKVKCMKLVITRIKT